MGTENIRGYKEKQCAICTLFILFLRTIYKHIVRGGVKEIKREEKTKGMCNLWRKNKKRTKLVYKM